MKKTYTEVLATWRQILDKTPADDLPALIVNELAEAWADGYNTSAAEEGFSPYPMTRWVLRDNLIDVGLLPTDAPLDEESK